MAVKVIKPNEEFGELFRCVQMSKIFCDSKTFVDSIPASPIREILNSFDANKAKPDFNLELFIKDNFYLPANMTYGSVNTSVPQSSSFLQNLDALWPYLIRNDNERCGDSSLLPLPNSYVVPGDRFREVYYWDSYFTMLGLYVSGNHTLARGMIENFKYLIEQYGFIPNGNRSYFLSRSQPPFFASMVMLLAQFEGLKAAYPYLPALEREYEFWMNGEQNLGEDNPDEKRVVRVDSETILNRYWDAEDKPRAESYREDVETAASLSESNKAFFYRNIRAAAESGWDFSSRWFKDGRSLTSIITTDIVPVDLNCLIYNMENVIARLNKAKGNKTKSEVFKLKALRRREAILKYFWNAEDDFFKDYNLRTRKSTNILSLAGVYPLYVQIASQDHARQVAAVLRHRFLKPGGLVTTPEPEGELSGQQWDFPNGWAPLQWVAIQGLKHYGYDILAKEVSQRWLRLNETVLKSKRIMAEKYNVVDFIFEEAAGGEYSNQIGFSWTNGTAIALIHDLTLDNDVLYHRLNREKSV